MGFIKHNIFVILQIKLWMILKLDNFTLLYHKSVSFTTSIRGNDVVIFTLRNTTNDWRWERITDMCSFWRLTPSRFLLRVPCVMASLASAEPASLHVTFSSLQLYCLRNVHVELRLDWGENAKMTSRVSLFQTSSHGEIHARHDRRVFKGVQGFFFTRKAKQRSTSLCGGLRCHLKLGRQAARKRNGVSYDHSYCC